MNMAQFRLFMATVIVCLLVLGGYLVWHSTHPTHRDCYIGAVYYKVCP